MNFIISATFRKARILVFVILCSMTTCFCIGQTREQMTTTIIERMNLVELQRQKYEFTIESLLYQSSGVDSLELIELTMALSNEEMLKRISIAFETFFNEVEITELHTFVNTSAFEKLFKAADIFQYIDTQFKDIDEKIEYITEASRPRDNPPSNFIPIPVDRINGFYATVDYDYSKDFLNPKLESGPSNTRNDIAEVKKANSIVDNSPEISITLTSEGAKKFRKLTYDNIGKPIAIVIDGKIVSLPIVQAEILGGKISFGIDSSEEELDYTIERLTGID